MKTYSESIAMRYGVREAIIAQYLWNLMDSRDNTNVTTEDSHLWARASATAIVCEFPYFSKHQVKDSLMKLRKEHILLKRDLNASRFDRTNWYAFSEHGVKLMGGRRFGKENGIADEIVATSEAV